MASINDTQPPPPPPPPCRSAGAQLSNVEISGCNASAIRVYADPDAGPDAPPVRLTNVTLVGNAVADPRRVAQGEQAAAQALTAQAVAGVAKELAAEGYPLDMDGSGDRRRLRAAQGAGGKAAAGGKVSERLGGGGAVQRCMAAPPTPVRATRPGERRVTPCPARLQARAKQAAREAGPRHGVAINVAADASVEMIGGCGRGAGGLLVQPPGIPACPPPPPPKASPQCACTWQRRLPSITQACQQQPPPPASPTPCDPAAAAGCVVADTNTSSLAGSAVFVEEGSNVTMTGCRCALPTDSTPNPTSLRPMRAALCSPHCE